MNATLLLIIVIVLLLAYIILCKDDNLTQKDNPSTISQTSIRNKKQASVIGTTKTSFPSRGTERKPKEADENRAEKPLTFVPESPSKDDENEFNPMPPESEIDEDEIAREDLSILLDEEIEVSEESLTAKEIRRIQQAVERNSVSEQERPVLLQTAKKLQGSDFLEKLKTHEVQQQQLSIQLMQLLAGDEKAEAKTEIETSPDNWTSFL